MDPPTDPASLAVENVGAIQSALLQFRPGVTIVRAADVAKRTTVMRALAAVLGGDDASVESGDSVGTVELSVGSNTYRRTFDAREDSTTSERQPQKAERAVVSRFAFVLKSNEMMEAARQGDGLQDLLFGPLPIDEFDSRHEAEDDGIKRQREKIDERGRLDDELAHLSEKRDARSAELEETRAERAAKREALRSAFSQELDGPDMLESKLKRLSEVQSRVEELAFDIETERESIDSLEEEKRSLEDEVDLIDVSEHQIDLFASQLMYLRERRRELDSMFNQLENIIQFDEELIADEHDWAFEGLDEDLIPEPLAGGLTDDETLICWTCGNTTHRSDIARMVEALTELSQGLYDLRNSTLAEIDRLKAKRGRLQEKLRRREELEARIDRVETELARRKETIDELQAERAAVESSDGVDGLDPADRETILARYEEMAALDEAVTRLEAELRSLDEQITAVRDLVAGRSNNQSEDETYESKRTSQRDRLAAQRERVFASFDARLSEILDVVDDDVIESVSIEQTEADVNPDRRDGLQFRIERRGRSGNLERVTLDELSEQEREFVGLAFSLAGYLVYNIYERVPFVLVDSPVAVDTDSVDALAELLSAYADYVVLSVNPDEVAALPGEYHAITSF